jgi:hypothetical protein
MSLVDSSRITREAAIGLIRILRRSEIQTSLHMEETKKAIIIKTKNRTMKMMAVIHILSPSNRLRIQLLLRNRVTSSTEIMMSKKKSRSQRSKNRKNSSLSMRMRETTRMPLITAGAMTSALSATLVAANLLRRHS